MIGSSTEAQELLGDVVRVCDVSEGARDVALAIVWQCQCASACGSGVAMDKAIRLMSVRQCVCVYIIRAALSSKSIRR